MEKERTKEEKKRTMEYERPAVVDLGGSDAGGQNMCANGSGEVGDCVSGGAPGMACELGSAVGH